MAIQGYKFDDLQNPKIRKPTQVSPTNMDEHYFDRMAAFGLACLAAAIVGKLVIQALSKRV